MLAAGHVSISNKNALPRRRQTEKYLQNCSGASRVSSSPQSTCSALQHSKNQGSAWDPWLRPATNYSPYSIRSKGQRDQATEQPSRNNKTTELRDEPTPNRVKRRGRSQKGGCVWIARVSSHQPSLVTSVHCG